MDYLPYEYQHRYSESMITAADHTRETTLCLYESDGAVANITLNNPAKLNVLGDALMDDLFSCLKRALVDSAIKVVVVKGAGRAFSAGLDMSEGTDHGEIGSPISPDRMPSVSQYWGFERRRCGMWDDLARYPKPIIGKIHGYCLGAAFLLARTFDQLVMEKTVKVGVRGFSEFPTGLYDSGFWPNDSHKWRGKSYEAETLTPNDWLEAGLISDCVAADQLDARVKELISRMEVVGFDEVIRRKQQFRNLELAGGLMRSWRAHQGWHVGVQWVHWRDGETNFYREKREGGFKQFLAKRQADSFGHLKTMKKGGAV